MTQGPRARDGLKSALAFAALIFGLWTLYVWALYPSVQGTRGAVPRALLNESARLCVFVLPVFLYLRFAERVRPLPYLRLTTNVARGFAWGAAAGAAYAALALGRAALLSGGGLSPKPVPAEAWFTALTVSTLAEEIAFRGLLLRKLEGAAGFAAANLITACLFVAIHFPGWVIVGGSALVPDKVMASAEILFLGLLLGYVYRRSGSLWACVVLHGINNLLAAAFFS